MKTNILIDKLPESVSVDGHEYKIEWNFRTAILFELLMNDSDYTDEEKILHTLELYYPDETPNNLDLALEAVIDFYLCGAEIEENENAELSSSNKKVNYSFEQDAAYIYAAFLAQYGIDLNEVETLHWWKFTALFQSLSEEQKISQIMYYRDVELKGRSKSEKKFLKAMKEKYALRTKAQPQHKLTLAQRNAKLKAYVEKRFAEIEMR